MSDSKVYLYLVTKRRQARRRIPRNSFFFKHILFINSLTRNITHTQGKVIGIGMKAKWKNIGKPRVL